jgi:hypothetical protein
MTPHEFTYPKVTQTVATSPHALAAPRPEPRPAPADRPAA